MTVAVALWRLVGILRPVQSRYWFSYKNAAFVAAISIGFASLIVWLVYAASSVELYYMKPDLKSSVCGDHQSNRSINDGINGEHFGNESNTVDDSDNVLTQPDFGTKLRLWIPISYVSMTN